MNWSAHHQDPANWLPVSSNDFPLAKKERYAARKKAIVLYLSTDKPIDEIVSRTGVSRGELYRVLKRAFEARADGLPVGYLACIPGFRLKQYTLTSNDSTQRAGRMRQFLDANPELRQELDDWALGKKKLGHSVIRGRYFKRLWLAFRAACEQAGLDTQDSYPFNNRDGGREAIRRYVKSLRNENFVANAKICHGQDSARLAMSNGQNVPAPTNVPYERVQLDGHRLDAIFSVSVEDPQGNTQLLPMSRVWLLVCIDVGSRAVLGYTLSLSENYSVEDVLTCIGSVLTPWKPKELPDLVDGYRGDAGLPSGVIDECAWRAFNSLQMDNAFSQLSSTVQERILESGALEVVTNKPRSPRSDSVVERFFGTFESTCLHLWPNTTGSTPQDPRRHHPEEASKVLNLQQEQLETVVDLAIANYNATPHDRLNGRSPIEYLRYRLDKGADLVRYAPKQNTDGVGLFDREYPVTIRANLAQGQKPYITFKNARYSSAWLKERYDLNRRRVLLRVDTRDIRFGQLFLDSGECLGQVDVEARWMDRAHTMVMRKNIAGLVKSRKLRSESQQPVLDYLEHLRKEAPLTRKARNELMKNQRHSERSPVDGETTSVVGAKTPSRKASNHNPLIELTTTLSR